MIRFLQTPGRAQKILLVGFLAIIIVMMVVTLVPGNILTDGFNADPNVIAKVGGRSITIQDATAEAERMIRQRFPRGGYAPQLKPLFVQQAVGMLVAQNVFLAEADRLGLKVTDDELRNYLEHGPYSMYLFPEGKYIGDDGYKAFTSNLNMSIPEFQERIKRQILIDKLRVAVEGTVAVGDTELRKAFDEQNTKVKFDYAVISMEQIEKTINPTEAEEKAYYEKNSAQFANGVPEQRRVSSIIIGPAQLPNPPQVSQDDIQRFYNQHMDEYRVPESVTARHILINVDPKDPTSDAKAKAKVEGLLKQVKGGANFNALAKKESQDPSAKNNGGELGAFTRGRMVPEFEQAAFGAKKGDIVGPVKTKYGYHIIQVEDKTEAHVRPLQELAPIIAQMVAREKAQGALDSFARTVQSEARSQGLEKTAAAHKLTLVNSGFFTREDSVPGMGGANTLMEAIFSAKVGDPAQQVTTPSGAVIFQVAEVKPPSAAPFESVKARIAEFLKRNGAQQELAKKTQELSEKARSEHNLRAAAKAVGATVKTSDLVRPDQQVPDLGQVGRVPNILSMKQGDISGPVDGGSAGIVIALLEKQQPTDADFALGKDGVKEQLLAQKRNEALDVYVSTLRDRMEKSGKLKMYKERLQQLSGGNE